MAEQDARSNQDWSQPIVYRVFLASPGDVQDERELARRVVEQIRSERAFRGRIDLQCIGWDQPGGEVAMEANLTPQEAIKRGLPKPSECDLVVVILWSRMGTPLPPEYKKSDGTRYFSGTEWEYLDAIAAGTTVWLFRRSQVPQVAFTDPEFEEKRKQWEKVQAFLKGLVGEAGFLRGGINDYKTSDDFRRQFEQHLRDRLTAVLDELTKEVRREPLQVPPEIVTTEGITKSSKLRPTGPKYKRGKHQVEIEKHRLPKGRLASLPAEVHLGAAAPLGVCPGEEFVARFAAYTETYRSEVGRVIAQETPTAHPRLDLQTCRWRPGTKVKVRLDVNYVQVSNPVQTFKWNGAWCILRFDCKVSTNIGVDTVILRFDVAVEDFPIVAIRPEIVITRIKKENKRNGGVSVIEGTAPRSAFASYAKNDRRDVLGRVRSLQIFTGIDVFLDCLSIRPGEEWKSRLKNEIHDRDIFWLFWSRSAMASKWVEWEWRTALAEKSLAEIQPHPLEPAEVAPPPHELSSLQFGAMYEWYVSQLRQSLMAGVFRRLRHKVSSLMRRG